MSQCNLDHSLEDVQKKYESQAEFLPENINALFVTYFSKNLTQQSLNEVFHLLKKYDLVSAEEREVRNEKLLNMLQ